MSLVYMEGFDNISTTQMCSKAGSMTGVSGSSYIGQSSPFTTGVYSQGKALLVNWQGAGSTTALWGGFQIFLPTATTYIVSCHVYFSEVYSQLAFYDRAGGNTQCYIGINSSGYLQLVRGNGSSGSTLLATGSTVILNNWYWLQMSLTIGSTTGASQCNINGVQQWNLTSANTQNTSNASMSEVMMFAQYAGSYNTYFDNLVIMNTSGSSFNGLQAYEMRIATVLPSGSGYYSQWSPVGATPNYACVDQGPDDGDTTYVAGNQAGLMDSYTYGSLPFSTGTILAVGTNSVYRRDDVTARMIANTMRISGVDYVSSNQGTATTSYQTLNQMYVTNGPDGNPWSISGFNNAQMGVKEIA